MKFIPFDKYTFESKKEKSELIDILEKKIEPGKFFRTEQFFSDIELKPYEGKIENNSFRIKRIIKYQNPFLPIITGKFKTQPNGDSKIRVIMRIRYSVLFFVFCWCLAPILFFSSFQSTNKNGIYTAILVVAIVFLVANGLVYIGFNKERNKSKQFLKNLLEAE